MNGKLKPFERSFNDLPHRDVYVRRLTDAGLSRKAALARYFEARDEEVWVNDEYKVDIRRDAPEHGLGPDFKCILVTIRRLDREWIHDWRDFQAIKNMLVGPEFEALELYPADSRVMDSANQYWLWIPVTKDGQPVRIPFGFTDTRIVTDKSFDKSVNRPLEV